MKRLLASVAISALALSGAAFAADAPAVVQKDKAPMAAPATTATTPAKPGVVDSHAKKPVATKKEKTSLNAPVAPRAQLAQAPAASTPAAKPAVDDSHAKKPAVVKKSDGKAGTEVPSASTSTTTTTRPATR